MSGSSKSLSRAIESVFQSWDSLVAWDTTPSPAIKELYTTIYAFNERHNSSTSNTNTNEILRAAYTNYIADSSDLSKEVFFVEVLSRLSPTLTASDVELWLKTYLRPALDSAGFDLQYVAKTRSLLNAFTTDLLPTSDPSLRQRREHISSITVQRVMQVYSGNEPKDYDVIQLSVTEEYMATQVYAERRRLIERNASAVLIDWGLQFPKKFFILVNPYFVNVKTRLKTLYLVSALVSNHVSSAQIVIDTPFYSNLLRCLCLDSSESVLKSAHNILMMLCGRVCDKIALYLPELFIILSRLEGWNSGMLSMIHSSGNGTGWVAATADKGATAVRGQFYSQRKFDLQYLVTLLYGLFPKSLVSFASDPNLYLRQNPPTFLESNNPDFFEEELARDVSKTIHSCLERCMLHPNFLQGVSDKAELQNPIQWILAKNRNTEIGEADVLFECLSLNPEIMISIPDDYILPENLISKIRSSDHLHSILSSRKASIRSAEYAHGLQSSHRLLSSSSIDQNCATERKQLSSDCHGDAVESINFKPFNFDGSSPALQDIETKKVPPNLKDDLSVLLLEHEQLYTSPASLRPNSISESDEKHSNGTSRRSSAKVEEMLKQLPISGGNILDFYHRELLLTKNELEFSIYLKSLYRLRYVKLKLKLNSMSESVNKRQEAAMREEARIERSNVSNISKSVLEENAKKLQLKAKENELLLEKMASMHSKIQELESSLEERTSEAKVKSEELEKTLREFQIKEEENIGLRNQIAFLSNQVKEIPEKVEKAPPFEPSSTMTYNERDFLNLKTEISVLQDQNTKAYAKLEHLQRSIEFNEKDFESRMANTKLEMRAVFSERSAQYEKKIKELNAIMLKYESALQEERVRSTHLSKTIPIRKAEYSEPVLSPTQYGSGARFGAEASADYFANGNVERMVKRGSHASTESSSSSSIPSTANTPTFVPKQASYILPLQASSTSMPIIKGRGGYQKRSKKLM